MTISRCPNRSRPARAGFTLVEMLIVIGIIIVLIGILMPMVTGIYGKASRQRVAGDLQAVAMALEAYKQEHGDYPRIGTGFNGAQTLARALIGPGPATNSPNADGADGPGFRTRRLPGPNGTMGDADDVLQGRVYGPYLTPDKFIVEATYSELYDRAKKPLLYFPASPARPNINLANGYVAPAANRPLYASDQNNDPADGTTPYIPVATLRITLGDANGNGMIDGGESAKFTGAFLLWSAGPDEIYDTKDDVTNIP